MMNILKRFLFFLFFLSAIELGAGPLSVKTEVDKSVAHIGDLIRYRILITYEKDIKVDLPPSGVKLGSFEIIDYNVSDEDQEGVFAKKLEYILSAFNLGEFEIPPLDITYLNRKGQKGWVQSEPIIIKIIPVPSRADDKDDIRDIAGTEDMPAREWLYALFSLFILGISSWLIYCLLEKISKRKERTEQPLIPSIEEDIQALERINDLLKKNYLSQGKIKQFYFELNEILRYYLHRRYSIPTMERTSYEILEEIKSQLYSKEVFKNLCYFFDESDMVKFAKYIPAKAQINQIVPLARNIINRTKRSGSTSKA
ncbi:MAG: hypothetical protein JW827_09140 [Spirochaetes bacterium]|nr:hypothetical protein [Spirochaetota bacterium]